MVRFLLLVLHENRDDFDWFLFNFVSLMRVFGVSSTSGCLVSVERTAFRGSGIECFITRFKYQVFDREFQVIWPQA